MSWRHATTRLAVLAGGLLLLIGGALLVAVPLWGWWHRGQAEQDALDAWRNGGGSALVGAAPGVSPPPPTAAGPACHPSADDEALVQFPSLGGHAYAGVAGDGGWDLLRSRSMVHYHGSSEPGAAGNAVIGFHREPGYEHIDELAAGAVVTLQDRQCRPFRYRVVQRWDLEPAAVTQLAQTGGHQLTLVTCTPWLVDSRRLVWRAELIP